MNVDFSEGKEELHRSYQWQLAELSPADNHENIIMKLPGAWEPSESSGSAGFSPAASS